MTQNKDTALCFILVATLFVAIWSIFSFYPTFFYSLTH